MIVYHGTTVIVEKPDISYSKRYLDFGRGFYLTTYQKQADRWAVRKSMRNHQMPIVNVYDMTEALEQYNVLTFNNEDEKWLDFVCACRDGETGYMDYDIVIGNVANDDIFKSVDRYRRGLWNKERTIKELRYFKKNDQIAIINQVVLNKVLQFKTSYVVEGFDGR